MTAPTYLLAQRHSVAYPLVRPLCQVVPPTHVWHNVAYRPRTAKTLSDAPVVPNIPEIYGPGTAASSGHLTASTPGVTDRMMSNSSKPNLRTLRGSGDRRSRKTHKRSSTGSRPGSSQVLRDTAGWQFSAGGKDNDNTSNVLQKGPT